MARKGQREESLYDGLRRKARIHGGCAVHLDPQGNKHCRLKVSLPLSNETLQGTPEWISNSLKQMQKDDAAEDYASFDRYLLGMAVNIYTTEKIKAKLVRMTSAELDKFELRKEGVGEKSIVSLHFQLDVISHKQLYDEMWDHHDSVVWMDFDCVQEDLPLEDGEEGEEGEAAKDE